MKKGLSEVVSSVLLIFIVIVLALIIFSFSKGFLNDKQRETEGLSFYYGAEIGYAEYYDLGALYSGAGGDLEEIEIALRRTDNEQQDIRSVRFIFEGSGSKYVYETEVIGNRTFSKMFNLYKITNEDLGLDSFDNIESVSVIFLYGKGNPTEILAESDIVRK
jgi:flagellin-like protein